MVRERKGAQCAQYFSGLGDGVWGRGPFKKSLSPFTKISDNTKESL